MTTEMNREHRRNSFQLFSSIFSKKKKKVPMPIYAIVVLICKSAIVLLQCHGPIIIANGDFNKLLVLPFSILTQNNHSQ